MVTRQSRQYEDRHLQILRYVIRVNFYNAIHTCSFVLIVLTLSGMIIFVMPDKKLVYETYHIAEKRGNGLLRREICVDAKRHVTV